LTKNHDVTFEYEEAIKYGQFLICFPFWPWPLLDYQSFDVNWIELIDRMGVGGWSTDTGSNSITTN